MKTENPLGLAWLRGLKNVPLAEIIGVLALKVKRHVLFWRLARLERRGPCAPGGPRPFDADLSLKIDVTRARIEGLEGGVA